MGYISNISNKVYNSFFDSEPSPLQSAIHDGDKEKVRKALDQIDLNKPMKNGHMPLHVAVRKGNVELIRLFIEKGADYTLSDFDGLSALDYAAIKPKKVLEALFSSTKRSSFFTAWPFFSKKILDVCQEASQFTSTEQEAIADTQKKITALKYHLLQDIPSEELSLAIHKQDIPKVDELLKKRTNKVTNTHLLRAIFMGNPVLVEKLLKRFKGNLNTQIDQSSFNLTHVAAQSHNALILKYIVMQGGDLQKKNDEKVAPLDLLLTDGAERDPLYLSKAKLLLTLFGVSTIFYENMVEPILSPQTAALFQGALLFLSFSTELALNVQMYSQLNPQTLFQKTFFWASNLAMMPIHMGISKVPLLKTSWDLWRCYHVTSHAFSELKRSFRHFPYEKRRALQHATLQVMTVGSTLYHCRKSAEQIQNMMKNLFSPKIIRQPSTHRHEKRNPMPSQGRKEHSTESKLTEKSNPSEIEIVQQKEYSTESKLTEELKSLNEHEIEVQAKDTSKNEHRIFCCKEKNIQGSCESFPETLLAKTSDPRIREAVQGLEGKASVLKVRVSEALENGGKMQFRPGTNGLYEIRNRANEIIALFKPENERNYGPKHASNRRPNPSLEDIHFHQMDSFEQGMATQRQYLSKLLDSGNIANLPTGTIVEMESDQFNIIGDQAKSQCKMGYLQEWISNTKVLPDFDSPSDDLLQNQIPLSEFQKLGIMDLLLYNQDRHPGNILVTEDGSHLINIDSDSILPWKIENNKNSLLQHPRAAEPFTEESLQMIRNIDPKLNAELAKHMGLPEQAATNARVLAMVLKRFASAGKTLSEINQVVGSDKRDAPSELWKKIEEARESSLKVLSKEDSEQYKYSEHLRWVKWWHKRSDDKDWLENYNKEFSESINKKIESTFWDKINDFLNQLPIKRHITFGTTYLPGNKDREEMSALVDANQKEYADRWGLTHRTVKENLLEGQCVVEEPGRQPLTYKEIQMRYPPSRQREYHEYLDGLSQSKKNVDCSPYWNKIKVLKDWLKSPAFGEEWYVMADDDMVVTNMGINPYEAIDDLRKRSDGEIRDTSVIVAKDVINYAGYPESSVNTGLLFVRKDEESKKLINAIWAKRNTPAPRATDYCPTLGVCEKQHTLHEQQALSDLIDEKPSLLNSVLTVVNPRDEESSTRGYIALNTFERSGRFIRNEKNWNSESCFSYDDPEEGKWRKGDWMGQAAGVPVLGWYCGESRNYAPIRSLRKDKITKMLEQVEYPSQNTVTRLFSNLKRHFS